MNREYLRRVNLAKEYISNNIGEDLNLDDIARAAHFSKYHFHRVFKAVTEETVAGYIRRVRLEMAANQLLYDSERSITTIAIDCGYGSSQNFATAFKNFFGASPTEFREKNLQEGKRRPDVPETNESPLTLRKEINRDVPELRVEIRQMEAYHVACVLQTGPYGRKASEKAFEKLYTWAYNQNISESAVYLGIIWDNPDVTESEKCRYDACMTVPEGIVAGGDVRLKTINSGLYAVCHCEVPDYESLEKVYEALFTDWFSSSDYLPGDDVSYEIYLNDPSTHPQRLWLIEICIPIVHV